jgi:hypothetical protein
LEPCLHGTYRFSRVSVDLDDRLVRNPVEFPIEVGGIRGSASLPELRAGAFGRPRLVTPPLIRGGRPVGWSDGRGPSTIWGWTWGERVDEDARVSVTMLAMRFPLPDDRAESVVQTADNLFESIGPWSKRLSDWVAIVLDLTPAGPWSLPTPSSGRRTVEKVGGLELQHVDAAGNAKKLLAREQPSSLTVWKSVAFLPEEAWWRLVERANAGVDPPTERLLLRDAREELEQDHGRRAVLDAATAAEIVLTQMLDDQLRGLPQGAAKIIRDQSRGLDRLASTLRRLGVAVSPSLQMRLADVRNQAIHTGRKPSLDEARVAYKLAVDLVEQARPLDDLLR